MRRIMVGGLLLTLLSACVSLAGYDEYSYRNLTALKGEVKVLLADCQLAGLQGAKAQQSLASFRVKLAQAYEYEAGKAHNTASAAQLQSLADLQQELYQRFLQGQYANNSCQLRTADQAVDQHSGCISAGYCKAKSKVLLQAFDLAISTEALKNR